MHLSVSLRSSNFPLHQILSLYWINSTNSHNVCVRYSLKLAVHLLLGLRNNPFYVHFLSTDTSLCTFNSFVKLSEGPGFCSSFVVQPKNYTSYQAPFCMVFSLLLKLSLSETELFPLFLFCAYTVCYFPLRTIYEFSHIYKNRCINIILGYLIFLCLVTTEG